MAASVHEHGIQVLTDWLTRRNWEVVPGYAPDVLVARRGGEQRFVRATARGTGDWRIGAAHADSHPDVALRYWAFIDNTTDGVRIYPESAINERLPQSTVKDADLDHLDAALIRSVWI